MPLEIVAVKPVLCPTSTGLSLTALKPARAISCTMTTISLAALVSPCVSVTVRVNVNTSGTLGAVKVAVTFVALLSVTALPPVCAQKYVSGVCPSESLLAEPSSVTLSLTFTFWSMPASEFGTALVSVTNVVAVTLPAPFVAVRMAV